MQWGQCWELPTIGGTGMGRELSRDSHYRKQKKLANQSWVKLWCLGADSFAEGGEMSPSHCQGATGFRPQESKGGWEWGPATSKGLSVPRLLVKGLLLQSQENVSCFSKYTTEVLPTCPNVCAFL